MKLSTLEDMVDEKAEIAGLAIVVYVMAVTALGMTVPMTNASTLAFGCLTLIGARYYRGVEFMKMSVSEDAGAEDDSG